MSIAVIAAKTAAETATHRFRRHEVPARVTFTGLTGSEQVSIKAVDGPNNTIKTDLYKDGLVVVGKVTEPVLVIDAPGLYEFGKPVTAGASGVYTTKD